MARKRYTAETLARDMGCDIEMVKKALAELEQLEQAQLIDSKVDEGKVTFGVLPLDGFRKP